MCIEYIIACARCHAPELIAATKFKTTKINFGGLFGLSTKIIINTHENYPLYGSTHAVNYNIHILWHLVGVAPCTHMQGACTPITGHNVLQWNSSNAAP